MKDHKLKFLRQSSVLVEGEKLNINVWKCNGCKNLLIENIAGMRINFNGQMGEEIK